MKVITLDQVKAQLGITDTSLDVKITAKIPIIDAKVKQITNNRFNMQISAQMTTGSNIVTLATSNRYPYNYSNSIGVKTNRTLYSIDDLEEYVMTGDQLSGDGVPTETYIEETYYNGSYVTINNTQYQVPAIQMSNVATETGLKEMFIGINIGYLDIIAKGVQYLITGTSQSLPQNRLKSKSLPPLSVTYADSKVNKTYGMPGWFVDALPTYIGGH
ncbi:MAG: hypothetical protein GY928_04845 [Colwellia sp.]|nr:hypothetical protein [Colwellia sp.]